MKRMWYAFTKSGGLIAEAPSKKEIMARTSVKKSMKVGAGSYEGMLGPVEVVYIYHGRQLAISDGWKFDVPAEKETVKESASTTNKEDVKMTEERQQKNGSSLVGFNKVMITGRLVRDPELRKTPNDVPVCKYVIAHNEKNKVYYLSIISWRKQAEADYACLYKGRAVNVEGRLTQRSYEDEDGKTREKVEVVVDTIQYLGPKKKNEEVAGQEEVEDSPF